MSSAPERPEAESPLPVAAPPRVSEPRQGAAVAEGRGRAYLSEPWAPLQYAPFQDRFEESESESEEGEEEEEEEEEQEEELEEKERRGVFAHFDRSGPQVICPSRGVRASFLAPDWDGGEPRLRWGGTAGPRSGSEGGPDPGKSSFCQRR